MVFQLNRVNLLFIGMAIALLFVVVSRFDFIFRSKTTYGTVIGGAVSGGRQSATPYIEFLTETYVVHFHGVTNTAYRLGEVVPVIYRISDPVDARVNTFLGFWYLPLLSLLLPLLVLTAALFSFFTSGDRFRVEWKNGLKVKYIPDPDEQLKEEREKAWRITQRAKAVERQKKRQLR